MSRSVQLRKITKSFGDLAILKGIDIDVAPGEFLILVGPSGCGKSTLLNCLAGLESPTSGDIFIGDKRVNDVLPKDRDIAMVFQSYALYPNMDVRENIAFGLRMRGIPEAERDIRIAEVARMLQLEPLLGRKPAHLSGGQRQRVAMGRALARNPGLFLFDEPLSNLDAKLRVDMRAEIKMLHQRSGITSVYVTHDQIEAMTLGDRVAVMNGGIVQQLGTPMELYAQPSNLFVATFMGSPSMNLVRGSLALVDDQMAINLAKPDQANAHVLLPSQQFDAPMYQALQGRLGQNVVWGFRPETVRIEPDSTVRSQVRLLEPTGPDLHVCFALGGTDCVARVAARSHYQVGAPLGISVNLAESVFFDEQTTQRIHAN
jgi:multiple sugar transport system ATP-binding protein